MKVNLAIAVLVTFFGLSSGAKAIAAQAPEARLTAEFRHSTQGYIKMQMDAFYIELANDPVASGYIYVFPKSSREAATIERVIRNSIRWRKYDPSRITIVRGQANTPSLIQFWLVPQGASKPVPDLHTKSLY